MINLHGSLVGVWGPRQRRGQRFAQASYGWKRQHRCRPPLHPLHHGGSSVRHIVGCHRPQQLEHGLPFPLIIKKKIRLKKL
jgi:hypothetical protein